MSDHPAWQQQQSDFFDNLAGPSNAVHLKWSSAKLKELRPEFFGFSGFLYSLFVLLKQQFNDKQFIKECLDGGDGRAAVVVSVSPLFVAAYSDELDTVALLQFPNHFVQKYGLQVGTRLLTVNNYAAESGATDLLYGPNKSANWDNMIPTIAEFASDDLPKIEEHKRRIPEQEWQRAYTLAQKHWQLMPGIYRDGRPFLAAMPRAGAVEYEGNLKRAQQKRTIMLGVVGVAIVFLFMCGGFSMLGRGRARNVMPPNNDLLNFPPPQPPPNFQFGPPPFQHGPPPDFGGPPPAMNSAQSKQVEAKKEVEPTPSVETAAPAETSVASATGPSAAPPELRSSVNKVPGRMADNRSVVKVGDQLFADFHGAWRSVRIKEMRGEFITFTFDEPLNGLTQFSQPLSWLRLATEPGSADEFKDTRSRVAITGVPSIPNDRPVRGNRPFGAPGDSTDSPANQPAPKLKELKRGTKVLIFWGSSWYPGQVVAVQGNRIRVAYEGWSSNEIVAIDRIRLREPKSAAEKQEPVAAPSFNQSRTWTDVTGKFKIEATLVSVEDGKVTLRKSDGTELRLPLTKLCESDRKLAEEFASKEE